KKSKIEAQSFSDQHSCQLQNYSNIIKNNEIQYINQQEIEQQKKPQTETWEQDKEKKNSECNNLMSDDSEELEKPNFTDDSCGSQQNIFQQQNRKNNLFQVFQQIALQYSDFNKIKQQKKTSTITKNNKKIVKNKIKQNKKKNPPQIELVCFQQITKKGILKVQKFPCFKDKEIYKIKQKITLPNIQQYSDDDKCSGDEQIESAANSVCKNLFQAVSEYNPDFKQFQQKQLNFRDLKIELSDEDY
ncbi:hypothetical protein IMG5_193820, partial [Ichthyophthirius multifiliis]